MSALSKSAPSQSGLGTSGRQLQLIGLISVVAFLSTWELAANSASGLQAYVSSPSRIWSALVAGIQDGSLAPHVQVSLVEFAIGVSIAALAGVALGLVLGWYRVLDELAAPLVTFLYSTPKVGFIGLIVIWVGIGLPMKVVLVFMGAFFNVLIATHAGVRNVDAAYLRCAQAFGATRLQTFLGVALPASVPYIATGIRLGAGHALVSVIVAEYYASSSGVGFLIHTASNRFNMDTVFVGVALIGCFGLLLMAIFSMVERRLDSWRGTH